ncbi:hypothetical protein GE09DRAFT_1060228 [Coniochaeta sp. 2T2.1]|nr:hypothetical protein GE09DRAFT_1060228 [Coniochaeta sp. 2T2.1]
MASSALRAPAISQAELESFHIGHFGPASISHFSTDFLPGNDAQHAEQAPHSQHDEVSHDEYQEDDGLGYYEDGVKRTLTDEQIAMFRHSELEARRRAQDAEDSKPAMSSATSASTKTPASDKAAEPDELLSDDDIPSETTKVAVTKKKKRRRPKHRIVEEKPDLRKRTWDVVDSGLGSLDYDEQPQESSSFAQPAQRRHISYDD